ncbi:MAG: hypothetical protein ACYDH1_01155 [Anaerolineaceae bacterium]
MNRIWKIRYLIITFLLSTIFLNSCSFVQGSGQPVVKYQDLRLYDGLTYGQSFYAKHNGLQSIKIYFLPEEMGEGEIHLYLRHRSTDVTNIAETTILRSKINSAGYYEFVFTEPNESYLAGFYVLIDYEGSGSVIVGSADQANYEDGAGFLNGVSFPRQLSFTLSYALKPMLISLMELFLTKWLVWIILSLLLFVLPGYTILSLARVDFRETLFIEKIVFSIGISLSITPILFLWTYLVGIKLGFFYAILPIIGSLGYFIYRLIKNKPASSKTHLKEFFHRIELPDLILFVLIVLLIFIRFWIIRPLPLPLWGDSYQHTLITQLLFENKGLFQSWEPYSDIPRFTYHFGFHSNAVNFQWLSGETAAQAVLVFGQIINILSVIVLYPIAVYLTPNKNKWAGVVAILIGGFFLNMPNFYTNWGRYTQLLGQVILLPCILFLWKIFDERKLDWKHLGIAAILVAGIAFSHYRILVIFVLFIPILLVNNFRNQIKKNVLNLILIGTASFLLFLPWFINAFGGTMDELFTGIFRSSQSQLVSNPMNSIIRPTLESSGFYNYISKGLLSILLLAVVYFLFKRNGKAVSFVVWWILAFIAGFPLMFYLPGKDIITGFALLIALYIPASIILGSFIGSLIPSNEKFRNLIYYSGAITCIFLAVWFGRQRLYDIDPKTYALATFPDLRAAEWINENVPDTAKIFINFFPAFNDSVIVGSDGGWWLPYLTKNKVNVPPLNYGFELSIEQKEIIIKDALEMWENGLVSDFGFAMLEKGGYDYIFIGQKQGQVNSPETYRLNGTTIISSDNFILFFVNDFVQIWRKY